MYISVHAFVCMYYVCVCAYQRIYTKKSDVKLAAKFPGLNFIDYFLLTTFEAKPQL